MFENIKIYPYRRDKQGKTEQRRLFRSRDTGKRYSFPAFKFSKPALAGALGLSAVGLFLGRAVVLGELLPFGIAFVVAAVQVFGRFGLISVPAVIAGLLTVGQGASTAGSIVAVVGAALLVMKLSCEPEQQWLGLPCLAAAATIIIKIPLLVFTDPAAGSYSYFSVLFEAVFAGLLTLALLYALQALAKRGKSSASLNHEEIFCLLIGLGGLIAGSGDLGGDLVGVKGTLSRLTILLAALVGGAGAGAAAGAVLGVIPGLAYAVVPALLPAYSFAGFLAGLCRGFGKIGVAAGFFLANIILTVYVTGYGNIVAVLAETSLATILFLLVPSFIINEINSLIGLSSAGEKDSELEQVSLKESYEAKIENWSLVFRELSLTFSQLSSAAGAHEEEEIQGLINQVGQKVCGGCAFYHSCWERELYKTYQSLIELFAQIEEYGEICGDNLPREIKKRCGRTKELTVAVACLYETSRINRYWAARLLESREIVAEQLKGLGQVIAGLPKELTFDEETGDSGLALRKKLKDAGVRVENLSIRSLGEGKIEITLTHPACGDRRQCRSIIAPLLSAELKRAFSPAISCCTVDAAANLCRLRFAGDINYRLISGVACLGQGGSMVSGDKYAFYYLRGGRFGLALSDGMGVGPKAALESSTTLSLLGRLLDLGFGQELAIKTVNSILALRSPGESFATVDLSVVDLYSGQVDFIKIGAVPTYLLRGGHVSQIKASSLPVGIIEDFEIKSQVRTLEPGDVLVMLTDGILDACGGREEQGEWLAGVLQDAAGLPPQEIADLLLKLAQTSSGGAAGTSDDMTVLAVKLEANEASAGR